MQDARKRRRQRKCKARDERAEVKALPGGPSSVTASTTISAAATTRSALSGSTSTSSTAESKRDSSGDGEDTEKAVVHLVTGKTAREIGLWDRKLVEDIRILVSKKRQEQSPNGRNVLVLDVHGVLDELAHPNYDKQLQEVLTHTKSHFRIALSYIGRPYNATHYRCIEMLQELIASGVIHLAFLVYKRTTEPNVPGTKDWVITNWIPFDEQQDVLEFWDDGADHIQSAQKGSCRRPGCSTFQPSKALYHSNRDRYVQSMVDAAFRFARATRRTRLPSSSSISSSVSTSTSTSATSISTALPASVAVGPLSASSSVSTPATRPSSAPRLLTPHSKHTLPLEPAR